MLGQWLLYCLCPLSQSGLSAFGRQGFELCCHQSPIRDSRVEAVSKKFRTTGFLMYPPFGFVANNRQSMFLTSASLTEPNVPYLGIGLFTQPFTASARYSHTVSVSISDVSPISVCIFPMSTCFVGFFGFLHCIQLSPHTCRNFVSL